MNDQYYVYSYTGDPDKTKQTGKLTAEWLKEVQDRGAGEIVLNCINQDGVRKGYDILQLSEMKRFSDVPLIASGGAGTIDHFVDVFLKSDVSGALAASVFHKDIIKISDLKTHLKDNKIEVRL
jgi:cyclase